MRLASATPEDFAMTRYSTAGLVSTIEARGGTRPGGDA
jgi:hypothetical protein